MKQFGIALILTCALSVSALAGDVPTAGAPAPPPTTQSSGSNVATTIVLVVLSLIR